MARDVTTIVDEGEVLGVVAGALASVPLPSVPVTSVNGETGTVSLSAADVGAATSAQGATADSAVQPGDDAADLGSGAATDGYVLTADGVGGAAWEASSGGGGGGGSTFKQTIYAPASDLSTTSTTYIDIDATNLPALSLTLAVGDVVDLMLLAAWGAAGGGMVIGVDWLVDQPTSADTRGAGTKFGVGVIELSGQSLDANTIPVLGAFVATEAGVHSFKPQWRVSGSTGYLRCGGTYNSRIIHRVTNLGAAS